MNYPKSLLLFIIIGNISSMHASTRVITASELLAKGKAVSLPRLLSTDISKAEADQVLSAAPEKVLNEIVRARDGRLNPSEFSRDCLMFVGKSGTGKFKSALSIAHKTGIKCFAYASDEITAESVLDGCYNIEVIFKEAQKHKPCIVIIKNLEYLIKKSKQDANPKKDMWPHLVWYLKRRNLFDSSGVHFIGTVNNWFKIAKPQREFLRYYTVAFDLPKFEMRRKALEYHKSVLEKDAVDAKVSCEELAAKTEGYSYKELKSVLNCAVNVAYFRQVMEDREAVKTVITMKDCLKEIEEADNENYAVTRLERESVDPITIKYCLPYALGLGVAVVALVTLFKSEKSASSATAAAK